jgi:hypothetical protein
MVDGESPRPEHDEKLIAVCAKLEALGVRRVRINYEGSGDEGCTGAVTCKPDTVLPEDLDCELRDVAEEYLPGGYENNAGGFGKLVLKLTKGSAKLTHWDRYEGDYGGVEGVVKDTHKWTWKKTPAGPDVIV